MTSQPAGGRSGPEYAISVAYYRRMKRQRVYPLVVEVPRGQGAVPRDAPSGMMVSVRPIVPGALVVPVELPLEVSRPGARAVFHVTPIGRGRLPGALVQVHHNGQLVQEVRTCMRATTQRWAWVLLLLALIAPPLLLYCTRSAPPRGDVNGHEATPGQVLEDRLGRGLREDVPSFPGRDSAADRIAAGTGAGYDALYRWTLERQLAFWLGVGLLALAIVSWILHRPRRARRRSVVALPVAAAAATMHRDATAETLPMGPPDE